MQMTLAGLHTGSDWPARRFAEAITASGRTRLTELLILCSRIGFNP